MRSMTHCDSQILKYDQCVAVADWCTSAGKAQAGRRLAMAGDGGEARAVRCGEEEGVV